MGIKGLSTDFIKKKHLIEEQIKAHSLNLEYFNKMERKVAEGNELNLIEELIRE